MGSCKHRALVGVGFSCCSALSQESTVSADSLRCGFICAANCDYLYSPGFMRPAASRHNIAKQASSGSKFLQAHRVCYVNHAIVSNVEYWLT